MNNLNTDLLLAYSLVLNLAIVFILKRRKKERIRRWWVRNLNLEHERPQYGHFDNLFNYMTNCDEEECFEFTRMSPQHFKILVELVRPILQKRSIRRPLSVELRVALTLSYLAQGNSVRTQSWDFRVGRSTAFKIIAETCKAISDVLMPLYIPPMNREKWLEVAEGFERDWQFPNCIGAVDGKHVRIKAPTGSGSQWWYYKGHFSLVLMAACSSNYLFTWVDIGQYGSVSDGGVWNNSLFGQQLANDLAEIPGYKRLPRSDMSTHHAFVGDEAFPLKKYLLRPYSRRDLGDAERVFNYRLSRARRTIENVFGILTSRWQVYNRSISLSPENACQLVRATVCLHNFIMSTELDLPENRRMYCPTVYIDREGENRDVIEGDWRRDHETHMGDIARLGANNASRSATEQRDLLSDYFTSAVREEQTPWQYVRAFEGININLPS